MEQASTMRLWPLVIVLAGWTAFPGLSTAAETPARSEGHSAASEQRPRESGGESLHPIYFAVMGEVAHPGAYEAPASSTLGELINKAGGITPRANRTVRIYRGGVPTGQVYLGSGADPSLLPGDLIVVARTSATPHAAAINAGAQPNESTTVFAVQIAFVNLIGRPVIVKMPSDQATLSRIVELLGQSSDCAAKIRVFNPAGISPSEWETSEQTTRPLESGTVLAFSATSIRMASLPALPAPIGFSPPPAPPQVVAVRVPEFKASDANPPVRRAADVPPLQHKVHLTIESEDSPRSPAIVTDRTQDIAAQVDGETAIPAVSQTATLTAATVLRPTIIRDPRDVPSDPHPGRTVAIMAAMSAVAGAAMLLTIISIVQRWLQSGKPPFQRLWNGSSRADSQSAMPTIPIPPVSPANLARRPLRIDAGQPITRLSVDLAAIERVTHAKSGR
jgi:hypothetical protein